MGDFPFDSCVTWIQGSFERFRFCGILQRGKNCWQAMAYIHKRRLSTYNMLAFQTFTRDECYPVSHCGTSPRKIGCQPLQPGPIFSCHRTIHDNVNLHGAAKVLALQLGTKQQHFDASKISQGLNLVDLLRLEHRTNGVREDAQDGLGTKRKTTEEFFSTSSTSSSSSSSSFTSSFSEPATRKKPKKKWLPPLGPPEAESAAILGKRQAGGVWGHTSAEAFSTLSTLHRL